MDLFNIYKKLPYFVQFIIFNIKAYFIFKRRFKKSTVKKIYKSIIIEKKFNNSEIKENNKVKLKKFFLEANSTKFWNEKFKYHHVDILSDDPIFELSKLPILTKHEVKKEYKNIVNNKYIKSSTIFNTSGTTGSGLSLPVTKYSETYTWLNWWYYRKKHGIKFNEKCAVFAGLSFLDINKRKPPYWMLEVSSNQFRISTPHLNINTVKIISEKIKNEKIKWIHGNPSLIAVYAYLCKIKKIDMSNIKIISIGAESLLINQKKLLQSVFLNSKIIQHYGQVEGVGFIYQNRLGELIVDENYTFIELLEHQPTQYKIIGTNYHNFAFPLFRYDSGDLVKSIKKIEKRPIKIDEIDGRIESTILLKNGTKISRLDFIFKDSNNVIEAQIIQRRNLKIDFKIVKSENFTEKDENQLINQIEKKLGKNIEYELIYVDKINKTKNGKLRFVISELENKNNLQ